MIKLISIYHKVDFSGSPSPELDSKTSGPVWQRSRLQPGGLAPFCSLPSSTFSGFLLTEQYSFSALPLENLSGWSATLAQGGGGGATVQMSIHRDTHWHTQIGGGSAQLAVIYITIILLLLIISISISGSPHLFRLVSGILRVPACFGEAAAKLKPAPL